MQLMRHRRWAGVAELTIMDVAQEVLQEVEESMAVVQGAVWVSILGGAHTVVVGHVLTIDQVAGARAH